MILQRELPLRISNFMVGLGKFNPVENSLAAELTVLLIQVKKKNTV